MNNSVAVRSIVEAIALGTPLVFGAVGEILAERAGVMNLSVDGMMLVGAVAGFWATAETGNPWIGVATALVAGMAVAVIHATLSVSLGVSQILSGLAVGIAASGLSSFIGSAGSSPLTGQVARATFGPMLHGTVTAVPLVGPILLGQDPIVYLSWLVVAISSYYLFRTKLGLSTRAVGENPASADVAGISVARTRYIHVLVGGAAAGVGGSYFSLAIVPSWQDGITAGAGWIALGLVIFSAWRPWRALVGAYAFGGVSGLNFTLQTIGVRVPAEMLAMLPYVATIAVLVAVSAGGRQRLLAAPAALGQPYARESRE